MKNKKWIDLLIVIFLIVISILIRSYYMSTVDMLYVSGEYLSASWAQNSNVPLLSFDIGNIYSWILTQIMLLFGKKAVFAMYFNILLQTLDILLVYGAIRFVFGRLISSTVTILLSAIPYFYISITEVSPYNLLNTFLLLGIYVILSFFYIFIKLIKHILSSGKDSDTETEDIAEIPIELPIQSANLNHEIPAEEKKKSDSFIEPPLPMPKKHVKKEMSYAFDPNFDMMHFDHEDMTGKDFFDLE